MQNRVGENPAEYLENCTSFHFVIPNEVRNLISKQSLV